MLPAVSVVLACYCEEEVIVEVYRGLIDSLESQPRTFEVIFVNDGSRDATLDRLLSACGSDPRVIVVDFVRNAGQWAAITAGIREASGEIICFMDCDLQLDPADLPRLLDVYDEGYDLVGGRRVHRHDSAFRRAISHAGNFLLQGISKGKLEDLGCALKVFNANVLRAFEMGPMTPFRPLQVVAAMDRMVEIPVSHRARANGQSKWGGGMLLRNYGLALLDLMQGRLRQAGICALMLSGPAAALCAGLSISSSLSGMYPLGLVLFLALLLGGMLLVIFDLMILSLAARRIRPAYIIRKVYRFNAGDRSRS
jgi:dolichol-phosphate mannosyltransferase